MTRRSAPIDHVRTRVRHQMGLLVFAAWILFGTIGALVIPPIRYAAPEVADWVDEPNGGLRGATVVNSTVA